MRISDWSSDVCSSDLDVSAVQGIDGWGSCPNSLGNLILSEAEDAESRFPILNISREMTTDGGGAGQWRGAPEIGRASCRERGCQYVSIAVVAVALKKKQTNTIYIAKKRTNK